MRAVAARAQRVGLPMCAVSVARLRSGWGVGGLRPAYACTPTWGRGAVCCGGQGHIEMRLCANVTDFSQTCLNQYVLTAVALPTTDGLPHPLDPMYPGRREMCCLLPLLALSVKRALLKGCLHMTAVVPGCAHASGQWCAHAAFPRVGPSVLLNRALVRAAHKQLQP